MFTKQEAQEYEEKTRAFTVPKQPEEPTEFFSTPIADSHDNNDGSENYQDNYDNGGYPDDENDYSDDDTEDNDDASRKKLFAITATITVGILVVVILAIVAGYKIFGFGGTNNKTTTTTKPKTAVAADDDSKGEACLSIPRAVQFLPTQIPLPHSRLTKAQHQPPKLLHLIQKQRQLPQQLPQIQKLQQLPQLQQIQSLTKLQQLHQLRAEILQKAVAAITAQIDGKVSSYEYRTEDAGFMYYYVFTEDGHGYSAAYNKQTAQVVLVQNY